MNQPIRRVGVVGAGVMGGGIAAHLANAGMHVELLDIVPPSLEGEERKNARKRNAFADGGLDKALRSRPASFFHSKNALLVRTGNTEDHLDRLAACDLVIEAIIERVDAKRALFEKLEKLLPAHCVVASNTSGIRIARHARGPRRGVPVALSRDALLQSRSLHEAARARAGPGHGRKGARAYPTLRRRRARQGHRRRQGHAELRRQPDRRALDDGRHPPDARDGLTAGGRRRAHRPPMAHPKSASFRTGGPRRPRHLRPRRRQLPRVARRRRRPRGVRGAAFIRGMVEKKLLGNKTKGGFYKKRGDDIQTLDPDDAARTARRAATRRSRRRRRRSRRSRIRGSACGSSSPTAARPARSPGR